MQRDSFIETLSNDMILNAYPNGKIVKWDQIAAGKKAFKKYWNYLIVRIGFNLLLPLIMLCFDIILPIKYLLACFFAERINRLSNACLSVTTEDYTR